MRVARCHCQWAARYLLTCLPDGAPTPIDMGRTRRARLRRRGARAAAPRGRLMWSCGGGASSGISARFEAGHPSDTQIRDEHGGGARPAGRSKYAPLVHGVESHATLCNPVQPPRDPSNPHRGFTDSRNPKCDGVTEARGGGICAPRWGRTRARRARGWAIGKMCFLLRAGGAGCVGAV